MFYKKKEFYGLLVGSGLIALFFHLADFSWKDVSARIIDGGWILLLGVSVFTAIFYYITTLKWKYITGDLVGNENKISFWHLYHHVAMGYLFALIIPQAVSDVGVRSYSLKNTHGIPFKTGAYSVLLDQFLNVLISLIFVLPAIAFLLMKISMFHTLLIVLVCIALFSIIFCRYNAYILYTCAHVYSWVVRISYRIPFLKIKQSQTTVSAKDFNISPEIARKVLVIGLIRHFLIAVRLYFIVLVLGIEMNYLVLLLCSSLMLLIGLVSFIPAQLGLGELGWYGVLSWASISDPEIVLFVISARIFSNLSIIATSGITLLVHNFIKKRNRNVLFDKEKLVTQGL
ncbi:MAG: flippase-like domain-containing protein [Candidatus Brocadiaceae bacterium]|nr:flippase-like domain-containing protein [Candidatus Brocadiaceae bacterium]